MVVSDASEAVLAVACLSSEDERAVLAGEGGTEVLDLRVADERVGALRLRARGGPAEAALMRIVTTLIGLEVERARGPERASEAATTGFLSDLVERRLTDRENILARAGELGCDLSDGATAVVARARPHGPEEGDWRARVLAVVWRGARAVERTSLAALHRARATEDPRGRPGSSPRPARTGDGDARAGLRSRARPAHGRRRPQGAGIEPAGLWIVGGDQPSRGRPHGSPPCRLRGPARRQRGRRPQDGPLTFEETGAYRLLLPAMSEDPRELQRFHDETVAPLVAYDDQYETELVRTLESFLEADGNVAKTAEKLFTHRHTIRYRLDRVHELSGLDVGSTDGRERLSLGLKSMRVLGIAPPGGPAHEAGAEAGRVPRGKKDR